MFFSSFRADRKLSTPCDRNGAGRRPTASLRTRIMVIGTVLCTTGALGAGMLRGASAADRPAVSRMGFYPGYGTVAGLHSLQSWLGHDTSYVVQFTAYDGARRRSRAASGARRRSPERSGRSRRTPRSSSRSRSRSGSASVRRPRNARAALAATAAGQNDAAYRSGVQQIKAARFNGVIIRLGWEYDGNWMPWSAAGNEALWARAYRHVHDVIRSVIPNARFDLTGDVGFMPNEVSAYPGDAYVDIIGMDVYDKSLNAPWNPSTKSWVDPRAAFNTELSSLNYQRNFAIAHGKQVSYPEWALATGGAESPNSAGSDNPTFIQGMYDWMNSLPGSGPGSLAYQSYFNEDTSNDGNHMLSHFPNAQARFRALFGGAFSGVASAPIAYSVQPGRCAPKAHTTKTTGYSLLGADGNVYAFGDACNYGNSSSGSVSMAARSDAKGYWIVNGWGRVSHFGTAGDHGGLPALHAGEMVTSISATRSGNGYWLFSSKGRVFPYGDARSYGDMGAKRLNEPVIASVASASGRGYYMVAADGGVFAFGDARFRGSMGDKHLNRPIVGLSSAPGGRGYWLVASDGGVFAFNAPFRGSMGGHPLARSVNGLVAYGNGYLMVASDGGVFDFSNTAFTGSLGADPPNAPIIGIAALARLKHATSDRLANNDPAGPAGRVKGSKR